MSITLGNKLKCHQGLDNGHTGTNMPRGTGKVFPQLSTQQIELVELRPGRRLRVLCLGTLNQHCNSHQTSYLEVDSEADQTSSSNTTGSLGHANSGYVTLANDTKELASPEAEHNVTDGQQVISATDYNDVEDNSTVAIFFLHGVGGSIEVWTSQINYLRHQINGCRVVAVDFLGHGHSSAPNEKIAYNFCELQQDIIELFKSYRSQKNVIVGHSYGCSFAVMLAHRYTGLVTKLVLIGGGSPLPLSPEPGLLRLPEFVLNCFRWTLRGCYLRRLFYSRDEVLTRAVIVPPTHVLKYTMLGQCWPEGGVNFHAHVDVDTLLIHGQCDSLISVAEVEQTFKIIKRSQLKIIEEAGHMVMMEKPDEVNRYLYDFVMSETK